MNRCETENVYYFCVQNNERKKIMFAKRSGHKLCKRSAFHVGVHPALPKLPIGTNNSNSSN